MGKGNLANRRPCPICGSDKKYKFCCRDLDLSKNKEQSSFGSVVEQEFDSCKNEKSGQILEPYLSGDEAESFLDFISKRTFLKPWVFKNPKREDGKEFTDVAVLFRDTLILIEVKGNKFNPKNPQRYLNEAKKRHQQLIHAERIAKNHLKRVEFKNDYFSFTTDFSEINKIYLISISAGLGELEVSSGANHIDYSKMSHQDVGRYLGFFDPKTNIHSFTIKEMEFASKHIDTIKDFFWYLDFEKKFLNNSFEAQKDGQQIIAVVDENREDMIAIYILHYYWDEELNRTGVVNLNKILSSDQDMKKADMIMYAGSDTSKNLENDSHYQEIQKEKRISYFWDHLIENTLSQVDYAYKLTGIDREKKSIGISELKSILEEMSATSRLERTIFCERIKESEEKDVKFRILFSAADDSKTVFSYARFNYEEFPNQSMQEKGNNEHLYKVWCRIKFGDKFIPFRSKIEQALLISKHVYGKQSSLSFSLSSGVEVDEGICRKIMVM